MKKLITLLLSILILESCNLQQPEYQQGIGNYSTKTHVCNEHYSNSSGTLEYSPNQKITIVGLNNVSKEVLLKAENILQKFYKYNTEIHSTNIQISSEYYYTTPKGVIDADKLVRSFHPNDRVLLITNDLLYGNNTYCRGYTTVQGKVAVCRNGDFLKETIIHEIGHTYGLLHCKNQTCVMAIYNDEFDSGTFCESCRITIKYNPN